jgi:nitrogen fixation protein FixH
MYLMHFDGSVYHASLAPPGTGIWIVNVTIRPAPARTHHVDVPFLIRLSPGHPSTLLIYPLSVPVNGWSTTLSLPFHGTAAVIHATIAADGAASFRIQLGRQTQKKRRSIRLKLVLSMLTMNMGHVTVAARPVSPHAFTARSFLSMPGAWSVGITDGRYLAAGALLIGEHR